MRIAAVAVVLGLVAWVADVPRSRDKYLALFNTNDGPRPPAHGPGGVKVPVKLSDLGFRGACRVRDLWRKQALGEFKGEFAPEINWHGAGLYRVSGRL